MSRTKNVLLNWYSSMKKKSRKILIIFDIKNWLWKSNYARTALFDTYQYANSQNSIISFDYSLFLGKNLSNFLFPEWKLHNSWITIAYSLPSNFLKALVVVFWKSSLRTMVRDSCFLFLLVPLSLLDTHDVCCNISNIFVNLSSFHLSKQNNCTLAYYDKYYTFYFMINYGLWN